MIREDAPVAPLFAPASFLVHSPKVRGIAIADLAHYNLYGAYVVEER